MLERTLDSSNVSHLAKSWTFVTHGPVEGSVAVVNGTAYFGDWAGYVYAVYTSNGTQKWNITAHNISANVTTGSGGTWVIQRCSTNSGAYPVEGVTGTPAVYGGNVYVVDQDSLASVHSIGGKVNWTVNLSTDSNGSPLAHYIWSSPLVYNGFVYVGMASGCDTPEVQGVLFKIPINSPSHVPTAQFNVTNGTIPPTGCSFIAGAIWSTPSVDPANNTIWISTGNPNVCFARPNQEKYSQSVIALNASTLSLKGAWQNPSTCAVNDCDFGAGPTLVDVRGTSLAVATSKNGYAYVLDRTNTSAIGWSPAWSVQTGRHSEIAPAAFDGSTVFFGGGNSSWNFTTYSYTGTPAGCAPGNVKNFTCSLSGVTAGNYTVVATMKDVFGDRVVANTTLWVGPPTTFPKIATFNYTGGSARTSHTFAFKTAVSGGTPPYGFVYANLPAGCSTANSNNVSCTATAEGLYHPKVTVTDHASHAVSASITMSVVDTYSHLIPTYWNSQVGPNFDSFNVSPAEASNSVGSTALFSVADYTGTWNIPDYPGGISAVNPTNHIIRWFHPTHGYVRAGITYTNGMVIDTSEWQNASGSTLEILNSSTGNPIVLENFTNGVQINAEPVVSDGRLFVGGAQASFTGAGSLTAFGLPLLNVPSFLSSAAVQGGIQLTLLGHVGGGVPPDSCSWTFGAGSPTSGCSSATHVYTANGSYSGTMFANDSAGEASSHKFSVVVTFPSGCPPVGPCIGAIIAVNVTPSCTVAGGAIVCAQHTWTFTASVTGGVTPYTYSWNFGDQSSSTLAQPTHTYGQSGTYTITLTVTDAVHLQTQGSFVLRDT